MFICLLKGITSNGILGAVDILNVLFCKIPGMSAACLIIRAGFYFWRAKSYEQMEKMDAARRDAAKAVKLDPPNALYGRYIDWLSGKVARRRGG